MYESLDKREVKEVEKSILDTWKKEDILVYFFQLP